MQTRHLRTSAGGRRFLGLLVLLLFGWLPTLRAQPVKGVVWEEPEDEARAVAELSEMHRIGVRAVRTGLLRSEALLTHADTLGLQLFQELPISYLSAPSLRDTVAYAARLLELVLARAHDHPSTRHFGLARLSDTSSPEACAYFSQLAGRVRERGPAGSQMYYLTPFIEAEQCAGTVDFVLLDGLDAAAPERLVARWQAAHQAPVGVGTLGTWVQEGAEGGWRVPHTPAAQARYLEAALHHFFVDTTEAAPRFVFVHRWRDLVTRFPSPAQDLENPYVAPYGLFTLEGSPRLAFDVVKGFYTGAQTVFAFPAGRTATQGWPWMVLVGWGVFAMLGVFYATSPRVRYMVPRYFVAHGFYREAVREGRDVLLGASTVLLISLGFSLGMLAAVLLDTVRYEAAFVLLVRWLPESLQRVLLALLAQPWMLVLLVGSFYALSMALWTSLFSLVSRKRYPLMPGQALMLVVWPRWPFLGVLIAALVVTTLPHALALEVVLILAVFWLPITLVAIITTLVDYTAVTRVPAHLTLLIGLANPLLLLLVIGIFLIVQFFPEASFLWHLALRP